MIRLVRSGEIEERGGAYGALIGQLGQLEGCLDEIEERLATLASSIESKRPRSERKPHLRLVPTEKKRG
jgi:hypothetical protein